jgi:putative ABC transport system substrate-binding protein
MVAGALVVSRRVASAQAPPRMPRVGTIRTSRSVDDPFLEGLRALGYIEGRNVVLEQRYVEGRRERLPALARELVGLGVDVIVASGPESVDACRARRSPSWPSGAGIPSPVAGLRAWADRAATSRA